MTYIIYYVLLYICIYILVYSLVKDKVKDLAFRKISDHCFKWFLEIFVKLLK